ncbi:hypothetical protein BCR34DRAFT_320182 [Clohesyomyces aquaticus]|uniref:Uncharacterized protein n=1 Tax=Clohesyomyces aquaticus TaxID=1231657 RepID=A0A1Y2A7K0_9PLEO|nr:hypothetical protein BCR34DRAFT_320182 [Clohesyomyces aquaticus]
MPPPAPGHDQTTTPLVPSCIFRHKLKLKRPSSEPKSPNSIHPTPKPTPSPQSDLPPLSPSLPCPHGIHKPLPDHVIEQDFASLYQAIVNHVLRYYSTKTGRKGVSQYSLEHATVGMRISWIHLMSLLGDEKTRHAALALCIAFTILSRSLLLKLGLSNNPGSTFLPPEIVECFQSFSTGLMAVMDGSHGHGQVHFGLLSRWKIISATLMHATYVRDAFSPFDSRTINIERALKDLDPLLHTYALFSHGDDNARLADLRDVLRSGAKFAFTLFSQPCFWEWDWASEAPSRNEAKAIPQSFCSKIALKRSSSTTSLNASDLVLWPSLRRVVDRDGHHIDPDSPDSVLSKKKYLHDFP